MSNVTTVCPISWEQVKLFSISSVPLSTPLLFLLDIPAFLGGGASASDV